MFFASSRNYFLCPSHLCRQSRFMHKYTLGGSLRWTLCPDHLGGTPCMSRSSLFSSLLYLSVSPPSTHLSPLLSSPFLSSPPLLSSPLLRSSPPAPPPPHPLLLSVFPPRLLFLLTTDSSSLEILLSSSSTCAAVRGLLFCEVDFLWFIVFAVSLITVGSS